MLNEQTIEPDAIITMETANVGLFSVICVFQVLLITLAWKLVHPGHLQMSVLPPKCNRFDFG